MIHMNHLEVVITRLCEKVEHGLTKDHILRRDRQNWHASQEITYLQAIAWRKSSLEPFFCPWVSWQLSEKVSAQTVIDDVFNVIMLKKVHVPHCNSVVYSTQV